MKNKLTKIFALLLTLTLVFSLAACNGNGKDTTTADASAVNATTGTDTTAPQETTAATGDTTAVIGESTTGTTDITGTTGVTGTTKATTTVPTTQAPKITAPVGGSIAQIVAFYNQYANATKAYKGSITVSGKQGTTTTITSVTGGSFIKNLAQGMVPNNFGPITTKTFKNGTEVGGTSTLQKTLPCDDKTTASTLEASGVKSATCVKQGTGWKVFIALKEEITNDLNTVPRYHGECMDTVSITANDLKPFTLVSAQVVYTDKSTISAVINSKGLLDSVSIFEPDDLTGVLKYGLKVNAVLTGIWEQYLTFKY